MVSSISTKIAKKLVHMDIVKFDDYEVCIYGLEIMLSTFFELIGILLIGYVLGYLLETIIFIVFFSTLRVNAGGYHAKTCLNCFILISVMIFGTIFITNRLNFINSIYVLIVGIIVSLFLILKYAPIDTPNKPMNEEEKNKYRKRSIVVFLIESLIILIIYFIDNTLINYCTIAVFSVSFEALTLLYKRKNINEE